METKFGASSVPLGASSVAPQNTIYSHPWMFLTLWGALKSILSLRKIFGMALDTILGDRTYPQFYLKLTQNGLKTEIWPHEA